jgi:hypothetical protein
MRSWVRTIWDTVKVFVLFVGCTLLFYFGFIWIDREYENYHKYDEPDGRAVKVYQDSEVEGAPSWLERLLLFYKTGE